MPAAAQPQPMPMPNDRITKPTGVVSTVVASVVLDDTAAPQRYLVLLLNPEPPFYTTAEVDASGTVTALARHDNVVPAVAFYADHGGDH